MKEANVCAKEFKRGVDFDLHVTRELPDWMGKKISDSLKKANMSLQIEVKNKEDGTHYNWSEEKFMDRLGVVRDLINGYFDSGEIPVISIVVSCTRNGPRTTTRSGTSRRPS